MKLIDFESSTIKTIEYVVEPKEIIVEFNNGSKYCYENCTAEDFRDFVYAESKGKFLNESIKPNHNYRKL